MGMITIQLAGSFGIRSKTFKAITNGHAHAVAQALKWLSSDVLPDSIAQDHKLHDQGCKPEEGFEGISL